MAPMASARSSTSGTATSTNFAGVRSDERPMDESGSTMCAIPPTWRVASYTMNATHDPSPRQASTDVGSALTAHSPRLSVVSCSGVT